MADTLNICGNNLFGQPIAATRPGGSLSNRFIIPPFTVLNARDGAWQSRKGEWLSLGIQSEVGRGDSAGSKLTMSDTIQSLKPSADQAAKNAVQSTALDDGLTVGLTCDGDRKAGEETNASQAGTSIFDPVLCELAYRWFCPPAGQVLDPFAGGSVRGIVAAKLGRKYYGVDLRQEQVEANRIQGEAICPDSPPEWACGDSLTALDAAPDADFIFTCPPYGDLERYSDDPRDISTMDYHTFIATYKLIILRACKRLKPDRFACVVVGDIRDGKGIYRNFVGDTIAAFTGPGLAYYNEAILVTMVGSLPVRVGKQFTSARKLGKTHQNVLVFVKGDPRKAAAACEAAPVETEAAA